MNRIYKNSDIKFNVDSDARIGNKFLIKFYTTNKSFNIQKTSDDVVIENETRYIKLNWSELSTIGDGVLNFVVNNMADDAEFDDKIYNDTFSRTTYYYISSNLHVSEDDTESFSQMLADLQNQANEIEVALSAEVDRAQTEEDRLQSEINDVDEKLTECCNAANQRIDDLVTKHDEDVTALTQSIKDEKERAEGVESNLTETINSEINRATKKENEISNALDDLETKHDEDVDTINATIIEDEEIIAATAAYLDSNIKANTEAIDTLADKVTNDIAKALQEERERATEADKELSQAIAKEKADRESTDSTLTANISAETTRAKAAEKKNADDISALTQTVNTNKTNLEKSISDEATARQNADTTLQTNIDNLTSTVSSNKSATDTAIANEKKAREEADTTLTNALDVEVKRAKAAEQANTTAIGNEETRAKGVEKGLADDIATLQSTKQDNLSGTPQQIKIENNVVSFADDAIWICGDY